MDKQCKRDGFAYMAVVTVVFVFFAIGVIITLPACQRATKDIASSANAANRDANGIVRHAQDAIVEVDSPPADVPATPEVLGWLGAIKSHLVAIVASGESVKKSSARIIERVPDVEDKVPWWAALLKLFAVIGVLALVVYIGFATGLFKFIKAWLWGLGLFIPKAKVSSAKLDAEALADPSKLPQAIASRRTIDPAYDAAFRKVKGPKA